MRSHRHADAEVGGRLDDLADRIDMALHDVAAQPVLHPDRTLEVDRIVHAEVTQVGARPRLLADVGDPPAVALLDQRQAGAVHGDRVARSRIFEHDVSGQREAVRVDRDHAAELLDDPGEHQCITIPPVTLIDWPVHEAASSDANHRTTPATSATLWRRPSGDPAVHASTCSGVRVSAPISVKT